MARVQLRCTGSVRLGAGIRRLHRNHKFAESLAKTVALSLHHSCRSELTRQGISLGFISLRFRRSRTLSFPSCVHTRSQSFDLRNPSWIQVVSTSHHVKDRPKAEKVDPLFRFQRMLLKERNDDLVQVFQPAYSKGHPLRVVCSYHAAPKEFLECMKKLDISLMLYDGKFWKHLILRGHSLVRINADEETTFAVHESNNPVCF